MIKFRTAAVFSALALGVIATPSFAITNASECQSEGGEMVNVKNSDYCLVPIRPEEYADAAYDGNQLGVVDCPGDKLNDGKYCMYPVTVRAGTIRAETKAAPVTSLEDASEGVASEGVASETVASEAGDMTIAPERQMTSAEKRAARKAAKAAKRAAKKAARKAKKQAAKTAAEVADLK